MSFNEIFKINQFKQQIDELNETVSSLTSKLKETERNLSISVAKSNQLSWQLIEREKFIDERLPLFDTSRLDSTSKDAVHQWNNAWSESVHQDPVQLERQFRAADPRYTPLELDRDFLSGKFLGLETDYHTTLTTCECMDFQRRALPCKHMYRLAHELDVMYIDHVQYDTDINHPLHLSEFKHIMSTLSDDCQFVMQALKNVDVLVVSRSCVNSLLNENILRISNNKERLLDYYKRDDLLNLLPENATVKRSAKKAVLVEYLAHECPDVVEHLEKLTVPVELSPRVTYFRKYI